MDDASDFAEAFRELRRDHPCFDLYFPPSREKLLGVLVAIDEARSMLRMIGYEAWAEMLDPVAALCDAETDLYPEEIEEGGART